MAPARAVPTHNPAEVRQTCLSLCLPTALGNQLALQTGKETLSHGVVIGIAHRAHRRPHTHLLAHIAKGNTGVLSEFNRSVESQIQAFGSSAPYSAPESPDLMSCDHQTPSPLLFGCTHR